jgi:hypothetical protein
MLALRLFLPPAAAENWAVMLWPAVPLLATLAALARIAARAGGRVAALIVLALTVTCATLFGLFAPGAIDHHNVQLALTLWTIALLLDLSPWAGLTVALSLGVGMETLPYAITAIAIVAIRWLRDGKAVPARRFALILGAASLVLLFGTTALRYRFAPACDTFSFFYATLLVAGCIGFAGLTIPAFVPGQRAAALAGLALALLGLAALLNAHCLAGPYGQMDPRLAVIFLSRVNEAQSAGAFAAFAPSEFFTGYVYALVCFLAALAMLWRRAPIVCAFAAVALAVASFQVREVPFAIGIALPGLALLIAAIFARRGIVAGTVALILLNDSSFAMAGAALESRHDARIRAFDAQTACSSAAAMRTLLRFPKGRLAAFVDQGPAILADTPDSVIAGPYHRDAAGILDSYAIFTGSAAQARAILKRRGIAYLMVCPAAPDWNYYIGHGGPEGLLARIAANRAPHWLSLAAHADGVRIYRIAGN